MKYLTAIIFFLFSQLLIAQQFYALDIPVFEDGQQFANPWVGGMNRPQWSAVDLNHDGRQDLYAFDRHGNVHIGFINLNNEIGKTEYKHARYWMNHFPAGQLYVMMRDYNRDGAADMFVSAFDEGLSGFKVFKGNYNANNQLEFDRIEFPEYTFDIIPHVLNGNVVGPVEVYNNPDYPAIDDIDGDGDLDILTMNASGEKVLYFKNIALESGFNDEVLLYELADDCWGKFGLTIFSPKLTLSTDANMCAFFREPDGDIRLHGGTTMCTFDMDNDGDKEILYGDFLYPTIIFATNGGSANQAWMTEQDTIFPTFDVPVDIPVFPASFHIDVNNDGARDLLFCPNAEDSPDVNTVWLYENEGSDQQPDFHFKQRDFIAEGILDFGTGANPVFEDVNADGLLDIVVGNRYEWDTATIAVDNKSYLVLLLNTGTATEPVFEVVDRDWLGLSAYNAEIRSYSPAFGDLDGDGDADLLIGNRQGDLTYLENIAGPGQPMQFAAPVFKWMDIIIGAYSTPFIFDVNKDGLLDLLIGERAGNINYLPNIGTLNNPEFHPNESEAPNNEFFGKITTIFGTGAGFSQPIIVEFDNASYLITGSESGWFMRYEINQDSLNSGAFTLLENKFGGLNEGGIGRAFFANINESNYLDAVIGNDRGGISVFQSPLTIDGLVNNKEVTTTINTQVNIYPNPAKNLISIEVKNNSGINDFDFLIFNSIGQKIMSGKNNKGQINIGHLSNGVYFLRINILGEMLVKKFVKH